MQTHTGVDEQEMNLENKKQTNMQAVPIKGENSNYVFFPNNKETIIIEEMLMDEYKDIQDSVDAYNFSMPPYEDIKEAFFHAIDKEYISITTVNSDKDTDAILDEDSGELRLRSPFSIFVEETSIEIVSSCA